MRLKLGLFSPNHSHGNALIAIYLNDNLLINYHQLTQEKEYLEFDTEILPTKNKLQIKILNSVYADGAAMQAILDSMEIIDIESTTLLPKPRQAITLNSGKYAREIEYVLNEELLNLSFYTAEVLTFSKYSISSQIFKEHTCFFYFIKYDLNSDEFYLDDVLIDILEYQFDNAGIDWESLGFANVDKDTLGSVGCIFYSNVNDITAFNKSIEFTDLASPITAVIVEAAANATTVTLSPEQISYINGFGNGVQALYEHAVTMSENNFDKELWAQNIENDRPDKIRNYSIGDMVDSVVNQTIEPPVIFFVNGTNYVLNGRTRLSTALASNTSISVKIISADHILNLLQEIQ